MFHTENALADMNFNDLTVSQKSRHGERELDRDIGQAEMDVTNSLASIEAIYNSCTAPHDNIATLSSRGIDVQLLEEVDETAALVAFTANMHISDQTDLADDRNWIHNENVSTMKLRLLFNSMQVKPSVLFILPHFEHAFLLASRY